MKLHVTIKAGFLALALMLAFGSTVLAQEETAATVTGQVTDSTGALIKAATVVITNERTQQERRLQTNDDGQFVVTPLVPGTYTLTVEQANFKKYVESGLTLNAKDRRSLNIVLEVGSVSESVVVTSDQNVVQDSPTARTRPRCEFQS
jgi:uncharacterized membrane protein YgcG